MTDDDLERSLAAVAERFEFGEYEMRAYLAVVEHGELTATDVADHADVPQPRVYDTVRSLSDSGLVELRESRPMRVRAVEPAEAFGEVRTSLDDLVEDLQDRYTTPARGTEAVSLVKSRATILRYLGEVIDSADYELVLALTPALLARFEENLADRRAAGVAIDLVVSPAVDAPDPAAFDYDAVTTTARVRRGITTPVVAVADGSYSVYATREALADGDDRYGVIFDRSELGFLVSGFLNTVVWTSTEPLFADGADRPFPRRYATIRRCVDDLDGLNGEFHATVTGRDVVTGELLTVEGRVVEASVGRGRETATIAVETDDGVVAVGGQVAALEDVEAFEIRVGRDGPPGL